MAPRDPQAGQSPSKERRELEPKERQERREKLAKAFVGLVGIIVSIPIFWVTFSKLRHPDIPPSFVRIGGESRIETAVEVASFWPKQPPKVVVVRRDAPAPTMLNAAECAVGLDAPVLFRPASGRLSASARRILRDRAIPLSEGRMKRKAVEIIHHGQRNKTLCRQVSRSSPLLMARVSLLAAESPSSGAQSSPPSPDAYASYLIQKPSDWKDSQRIIFATAQHEPDLPDVAVAIALAAHLNTTSDLRNASPEEHFTVVLLPRYLQADPDLMDALRDHGRKVKEAYVIGGPDAISNSLRDQLNAAIVPLDRLTLWQTIRELTERVFEAVVAIVLFILGVKTANNFLEAQGKQRLNWSTLPTALLRLVGKSQDDRPSSYLPKDDGRSSSLPKFARVWLKSPPRWIIGSWPDQDPSAWPRAEVATVRLTSLVEADPSTGFVRLGSDGRLIPQKEELIVPWSEVQFLELADDWEPWRGPGPTDGKQPGTLLYDLIQEVVTTYSSSSAKRSRRPG